MHFKQKNTLNRNRYHNPKHALNLVENNGEIEAN
jgi:hypothetical protein